MRIAVPVIGFVIDAIQKSVSAVIGLFAARSAKPVLSRWRTLSFEATTVTAPAISFFAISVFMASSIPGNLGAAAKPASVAEKARTARKRYRFMAIRFNL